MDFGEWDILPTAARRVQTFITRSGLNEVGDAWDIIVMSARCSDFGSVNRILANHADVTRWPCRCRGWWVLLDADHRSSGCGRTRAHLGGPEQSIEYGSNPITPCLLSVGSVISGSGGVHWPSWSVLRLRRIRPTRNARFYHRLVLKLEVLSQRESKCPIPLNSFQISRTL